MDTKAAPSSLVADPAVATMDMIDWAKVDCGESQGSPECV